MPERQVEKWKTSSAETTMTVSQMLHSVGAAWVLSIGVDFLLHGGILSKYYLTPSPFVLEPQEAFRRIPLGYLAFLILTFGLYWLFRQLNVCGAGAGFRLGFIAGFVVWGALVFGLYSISTIEVALVIGWWLGQSLELGLAGAVFGSIANGAPLKRIWALVVIAVLACITLTIVLQSLAGSHPP